MTAWMTRVPGPRCLWTTDIARLKLAVWNSDRGSAAVIELGSSGWLADPEPPPVVPVVEVPEPKLLELDEGEVWMLPATALEIPAAAKIEAAQTARAANSLMCEGSFGFLAQRTARAGGPCPARGMLLAAQAVGAPARAKIAPSTPALSSVEATPAMSDRKIPFG